MILKRFFLIIVVLALLAALTPASAETVVDKIKDTKSTFSFDADADLLEVVFPQIYDCDAMLIRQGDATMLVDTATDKMAPRVIYMLDTLGVEKLDAVLITHPHHDHMGGLEQILEHMPVGMVLTCFPDDENEHSLLMKSLCDRHAVPLERFGDGDRLEVGGATLDILLKADRVWSVNDRSAVALLTFGERTMLLTADIEANTVNRLTAEYPTAIKADILKYPHHGKSWLGTPFHNAVGEKLAIMTLNDRPTQGKQDMRVRKIKVYLTTPGFLSCTTDGATWVIERSHEKDPMPPLKK